MHLARVSDSSERLIVDYIVKYAAPHLKHMLMIRFNPNRLDYIAHSQELIAWAQEVEDEQRNAKKMGRDVVAVIGENRQCFNCGAVGQTQYDCLADVKRSEHADTPSDTKGNNRRFALAVSPISQAQTLCASNNIRCQPCWVMDSGASRHLVGDETLLHDAVPCADGLTLPNDAALHVTKVGSVTFMSRVDDDIHEVTLPDVYFAPSLFKDLRLISYGQLKKRVSIGR
ncbi:hypothetical protein CCR75_001632 [Bremia lactucae]|uniref:Retrovirus-related Pol polyprotein from transposon TNT 1-94-like beta-barrel domain-containing protein n=1 Tax=Bremia lactucae TaxID=4779 RepID=A0A976IG59_BRELC|nr:hypothetical protein CCR75_001632 [Bremia lactucae]